jgi:hypothetical protein
MLIAFLLLTDYGESLNGKLCQLERPELFRSSRRSGDSVSVWGLMFPGTRPTAVA